MFLNRKILLTSAVPPLGSFGYLGYSSQSQSQGYKIMVNYNGQADLLLSLGIWPDYYPYQFKKTQLYDYLTNMGRYIVVNDNVSPEKKKIKEKMQGKVDRLLRNVKEFGPSLWNEDLYDTGLVFRNDQFWSKKETSVLFLEQFISDDYQNIDFEALDILPRYKDLIVTNYRAARDPYTIFGEEVFKCFRNPSTDCKEDGEAKKIADGMKAYLESYNQEGINALYRTGKYMEFWNRTFGGDGSQSGSGLNLGDWIRREKLFSLTENDDKKLAEKYARTIFDDDEVNKVKEWLGEREKEWKINYLNKTNIRQAHHPALEQQIIPGSAPLSEGSQKDIVMFLIQFSKLIGEYVKGENFKKEFKDDPRMEKMKNAEKNAEEMAKGIKERIKSIREYFKEIKVVDNFFDPDKGTYTNDKSKTFTVLTFPPSSFGAGEATIQSMSKFPFIYHDIGLRQPIPADLENSGCSELKCEMFSVDDNGWWWKVGDARMDPTNILKFRGTADTLLLLAHEDDWNILRDENSAVLGAIGTILKTETKIEEKQINVGDYPVSYNKYHLWNEGLRSPIALHLLLDNLVDIFQRQYDATFTQKDQYQKAMDWGDYWGESHFLAP